MSVIDQARPLLSGLLRQWEGLRLSPYRCPAGVPTIGVGATTYLDGRPVTMADQPITEEQALRMLDVECDRYLQAVMDMCTVAPSGNELAALAGLAYNIGLDALRTSTALRQHNAGNHEAAGRAIALWDKARVGGTLTVLPGLTARRAAERALYLTPASGEVERMPQAVESESPMAASPINRGGAAVVGLGAIEGLRQAGDSIAVVRAPLDALKGLLTDTIGLPPEWLLPVALAAVGAYVVYWRLQQRRQGFA
ncbi:MAG TPA: lysozyme [Thauera aminoaromatica]|nr:lysozyme [Thauera aminoaromatica]HND57400.1 lysozyme [Thauera aminoaromatica]HON29438.1 lysozyme [Ottowia sp.]